MHASYSCAIRRICSNLRQTLTSFDWARLVKSVGLTTHFPNRLVSTDQEQGVQPKTCFQHLKRLPLKPRDHKTCQHQSLSRPRKTPQTSHKRPQPLKLLMTKPKRLNIIICTYQSLIAHRPRNWQLLRANLVGKKWIILATPWHGCLTTRQKPC